MTLMNGNGGFGRRHLTSPPSVSRTAADVQREAELNRQMHAQHAAQQAAHHAAHHAAQQAAMAPRAAMPLPEGYAPSTAPAYRTEAEAGASPNHSAARPAGAELSAAARAFVDQLHHVRAEGECDDITFKIHGADVQVVEVMLGQNEGVFCEPGSMICMHGDIEQSVILSEKEDATLLDKVAATGRRVVTGESLTHTCYTNVSRETRSVILSGHVPGTIVPLKLSEHGGSVVCQQGAFLAAARGVEIKIGLQTNIMAGLFNGEGFILQRLVGTGWVFVYAGGSMIERTLERGEHLIVNSGSLVAYESTVETRLAYVAGVRSGVLGGEGLTNARVIGPGKVWLQSVPLMINQAVAPPKSGIENVADGVSAAAKILKAAHSTASLFGGE